ncbi:ATP-binding protein [Paractinoplanes toevensis]|uniref:ATPase AAA n=1 Tax=Paractinoplanes toevensis TaxID=571911 RepID=A0A919TF27_9ACTN|nr:ATP-binding protein [Actinoplanes toevensis]GIM93942.1 ATPase AAA [Actinoplanes toevensis]
MTAWITLADALLQREALICRLGEGRPPRDFAGLYVDNDEVDRLLATLPGLNGPGPERVAAIRAGAAAPIVAAREALATAPGEGPLGRLVAAAGLSPAEAEVLALLVAVETSPARQRLVAYIQDSVQLPRLTLATIERIFPEEDHPAARVLSPGGGLVRTALARLTGDGPWASLVAEPATRLIWHLTGDDTPDPGLPAGAAIRRAAVPGRKGGDGLLLVHGGDRESRLRTIGDDDLLVTDPPSNEAEWQAVVREATIGALTVVLDLAEPLPAAGRDAIERARHLGWALSSPGEQPLEAIPGLRWRERHVQDGVADDEDWQHLLGRAPDPAYRLSREQLRLVAGAASADGGQVAPAVRRLAGGHLDGVAVRIRPRRVWDDLILPPEEATQLRELAQRHRGRDTVYGRWQFSPAPSTGVVALFAGPSGTGKTLAAEVVAGELGLDLYKVDLSSVVSKYIGETEKNLERIFGAAAAGDLVLFFDEADALFGKRSEVSDAHDRYANIEVAYLLQRLETYDGMVVLATNLQRNIDPAFLRRISVAIDFVPPEEPERRQIWARTFPSSAPVSDLDIDFLARQFKITGGVISNAALGAAFLAAAEDSPITMRHAVLSVKREFQKMGRLRTEKEFDIYFDLVNRNADAAPAG